MENFRKIKSEVQTDSSTLHKIFSTDCYQTIIILFFYLIITSNIFAQSQRRKNVLIINSYHRGYDWSDRIMDAIQTEFNKSDINPMLFFEYMDTKRYDVNNIKNLLKELWKVKYKDHHFDVIITSDDNAVLFLIENRDYLFPKVPVVFCGASYQLKDLLKKQDLMTGIIEYEYILSTLQIALNLHPSADNIIVLADSFAMAAAYKDVIETIKTKLDRKVFVKPMAFLKPDPDKFSQKLRQFEGKSIMLLVNISDNWNDGFYAPEKVPEIIKQMCNIPVYGLTEILLGSGIIGGNLSYASGHGGLAAQIAIDLMKGKDIQDITIPTQVRRQIMFDYKEIKRKGIPFSLLPKKSIVINQPETFYSKHKTTIWIVILIIVILILTVILLSIKIKFRKQAEKNFMEINESIQNRIGRDLHDSLGQHLSGLRYFTGALEEELSSKELPYAADVKRISQLLTESIKQSNHIVKGLYPADINRDGLITALRSLATNMGEILGISCLFECKHDIHIQQSADSIHIYRIIQEAVNNAVKHGKAKEVRISLNSSKDTCFLTVQDNGIGFQKDLKNKGMGLQSIQYRIKAINGIYSIESKNGKGTILKCSFPNKLS